MLLFGKERKKKLEMVQAIRPTSKATLKIQCLFACKGNIEEAGRLYDYFAKDMPELPDYDPVQPTWMDNTKESVNGVMAWFKENKDTLAQGYEFIREIVQNRSMPAAVIQPPTEPLPNINE